MLFSLSRRDMLAAMTAAAAAGALASPGPAFAQAPASPLPRKPLKVQDKSDAFFLNGEIPKLKLELTDPELNKLRQNNRAYVRCKVTENDKTEYREVGVKLKGAAGSFRGVDDRPALTLNFDKFIRDQSFRDLDKIHLNNSVQDPTYFHEILCSEICSAAGVPAARATHARVFLNNRDLGFYGLKEGFDKKFCKRHFGNGDGNLYDGGFLQDVDANLEKDSGHPPDDRADLKALVAACREGDPATRWTRLTAVLDVPAFCAFVAIELMCCHWDGYVNNRNNYRVYFDPTSKKAYFFPHGMDQMFGDTGASILHRPGSIVGAAVLNDYEGRSVYRDTINQLMPIFSPPDKLCQRVDQLQARLKPVLAAINEGMAKENENQAKGLKDRLIARAKNLEQQNAVQEPRPLKFSPQGAAPVVAWAAKPATDAKLAEETPDNIKSLGIACGPSGRCVASWRAKVLLPAGEYKFVAKVKTADVVSIAEPSGSGAGVRLSGGQRTNKVEGNTGWTPVEHAFTASGAWQEIELVCELRATKGQAWFDKNSLQVVKVVK
jgi:hypothetical protein